MLLEEMEGPYHKGFVHNLRDVGLSSQNGGRLSLRISCKQVLPGLQGTLGDFFHIMEHNEISKHPTARGNVFLTSCPQDSAYQRLDTDYKMQLSRPDRPTKYRRNCRQSSVTAVQLFSLPLLLPFLLYLLNL